MEVFPSKAYDMQAPLCVEYLSQTKYEKNRWKLLIPQSEKLTRLGH